MLYYREATMLFCHSILLIFIMIYYRGNMSFCYSILLIPLCYTIESQLCRSVTPFYPYPLYQREATMSFSYSVLPISTMLYYREATISFCYSILPISIILYYREATSSLLFNFTHIHYVIL